MLPSPRESRRLTLAISCCLQSFIDVIDTVLTPPSGATPVTLPEYNSGAMAPAQLSFDAVAGAPPGTAAPGSAALASMTPESEGSAEEEPASAGR